MKSFDERCTHSPFRERIVNPNAQSESKIEVYKAELTKSERK
jgi:hypothetical protein